jgi:PAS domain S-box-containing protein
VMAREITLPVKPPLLVSSLCSQEQIHIPGNVQPHGALLAVDPALGLTVIGASRNAEALLRQSSSAVAIIGCSLTNILGAAFSESVWSRFHSGQLRGEAPWQSTLKVVHLALSFDVSVHVQAGLIIIEIERVGIQDEAQALTAMRQLQDIMVDLREAESDLDTLAGITVRGIRLLTGYERAMVYRFDAIWNGEVIAEDKAADWDQTFDGMQFPASDIPAQARELYRRSPMRWVADRDALPVPLDIAAAWAKDRSPPPAIDLSFAHLRSQSPSHMQIHRNLQINGSMSVSILYHGQLWGLIICHHRQPYYPAPVQRSAAAALTDAFALRIGPAKRTESVQAQYTDLTHLSALMIQIAEVDGIAASLAHGNTTIADLFASTAAAVVFDNDVSLLGNIPSVTDVQELVTWLRANTDRGSLFQTSNLGAILPSWQRHEAIASGLLAMFIGRGRSDMLLWFRPEQPRTVTWGGSRLETVPSVHAGLPVYSSAEASHGFAKPWAEWEVEMADTLRHNVTEIMVRSLRRVSGESRAGLLALTAVNTAISDDNSLLMTTQAALRKSEERFRLVVEGTPNAMIMVNSVGLIEMVNTETERLFGYTRAELLGAPVEMLIPVRMRARHSGLRTAFFADTASRAMKIGRSLFVLKKDGREIEVEIGLNPVETADGVMVLSAIVDISSRMRLEAQVRQSQKMHAMGRITAGVAHDFNNLLLALSGSLEMLLDVVSDRPRAVEWGQIALRSTTRGKELTDRLLSFSRQQVLEALPISIDILFGELKGLISHLFETNLGAKIDLVMMPCSADLAVLADFAQLEAALINLAVNARDAMAFGGCLRFSVYTADADLEIVQPGSYIVISIADTGAGMDADTLAQACDPFFSTKGANGTGLGLSMVHGFALQSGGAMLIASVEGEGTTIDLWLPSVTMPNQDQTLSGETGGKIGHVLVVDDNPDALVIVSAFLQHAGLTVISKTSGDLALAELASGKRFDAIVTDFAMPGMNGLELLTLARAIDPSMASMIITGFSDPGLLSELKGIAVLRKPFNRVELVEIVKTLIAEHHITIQTIWGCACEPARGDRAPAGGS